MADYGKDILRTLRSIDQRLKSIDRKLSKVILPDVDPFDPDDDDDVTEDDLPFVVPGSRYDDDLK